MDTPYFVQALEAYRVRTGDVRPWEHLPLATMSAILTDAQRLKLDATQEGYIVTTPDTRAGQPRIVGTRITVAEVMEQYHIGGGLTNHGEAIRHILKQWPHLKLVEVEAAVKYAQETL